MKKNLVEKIRESLAAVLPITAIVFVLSITIVPLTGEMLFMFAVGAVMLIIGIGFFTLGADTSMMTMGEEIGTTITKSKKMPLILFSCFIIGMLITIAEPDLRVLAEQVAIIDNYALIIAVAAGVGVFLLISFLRIFLQIKISHILLTFYLIIFGLALSPLIPNEFIPVAFDSGGVTTGPITVPFIMALGLGLAALRGDKTTQEDTFGLVALCSIGPILTVLILGALSNNTSITAKPAELVGYSNVKEAFSEFIIKSPHYFFEVSAAVLPIIILCFGYQIYKIKMDRKSFLKVLIGFAFTYIGLVLFLTGVNVGFMPVGQYIGETLAKSEVRFLLVPLGAIIGYFVVSAEPAVHTLKLQVEDVTEGQISGKALGISLSIGVAVSVGLSMIRVLAGIPLMWFLIPGYAFSLLMTFFVPPIFTAIAFDSGGVASGPMTATFILPFAMGACAGVGGNIANDAFGIVAMVAMTPLLTIQILGMSMKIKARVKSTTAITLSDDIVDIDKASQINDDIIDV